MSFNPYKKIGVSGFNEAPVLKYPLAVFDVNGLFLGISESGSELVNLWNSSEVNRRIGLIKFSDDQFSFDFFRSSGKDLLSIRAVEYNEVSPNFLEIGTSYFSGYAEGNPKTYQMIYQYWGKEYTGFNAHSNTPGQQNGNNGKVAHDRTRFSFVKIDGINNPDTTFFYWGVNDILYQGTVPGQTNKPERAAKKIAGSHNAVLANSFSKSFNAMVDELKDGATSDFTDTGHTYGSKSEVLGKNVVVLAEGGSVSFEAYGPIINIGHFVSDGVAEELGIFEVEVDGKVVNTIDTNSQTIDLTGQNNSIPTEGDAPISPASLILQVQHGKHQITIRNISVNDVWMDYWSEIETDISKGAKPVFMANIPKFNDGDFIPKYGGGGWPIALSDVQLANQKMKEVWDFWKNDLKAPAYLADVYTTFDPVADTVFDKLHFSLLGSGKVLGAFNKQIQNMFSGKEIYL